MRHGSRPRARRVSPCSASAAIIGTGEAGIMGVAPPGSAPSVSGRVLQPIPSRSPHQTPKFCVHFLLVPPRRVPADGATLIKLHQVAAMKNLRAQSVHLAAALS